MWSTEKSVPPLFVSLKTAPLPHRCHIPEGMGKAAHSGGFCGSLLAEHRSLNKGWGAFTKSQTQTESFRRWMDNRRCSLGAGTERQWGRKKRGGKKQVGANGEKFIFTYKYTLYIYMKITENLICTIGCVWYLHPTCPLWTIYSHMFRTTVPISSHAHRHKHTNSVPAGIFYSRQ